MSDLFSQPPKKTSEDYSAKDIEVLEGLEPVRRRPGMYIGGTDDRALHHLVVEILDNAMDEAVAGHASRIEIEMQNDGSVTIRDNGRGIPIDPHPKYPDKSALEVIFTTLHSGGKFGGKAYETSGGLHGVGVSVVNALSDSLIVEVVNQRQLWRQTYSRGETTSELTLVGPIQNRRGTSISFHPDHEIFGQDAKFNPKTLYNIVRSKAYLFRGIEIRWQCDPDMIPENSETPSSDVLHFPGGINDYLNEVMSGQDTIFAELFSGQTPLTDGTGRVEWAITWPLEREGFMSSYCNTIATPLGGTHENGFKNAITKSLKAYGDLVGNRRAAQITSDDVIGNAAGVLSIFIREPQFQGQTKEKLSTPGVSRQVENVIKDHFDHWLSRDRETSEALLNFVIERSEDRLKRRHTKDTARASATRRLRLPGKLADCMSTNTAETELFLVEGDSAGGTTKQARDRKRQAVLPLRGKILNVASASNEKMLGNQEIQDMGQALGCGVGKNCDPEKLRYGRIIIMTDADVDGAHIASLLLTYFFIEMRPLLDAGCIYLAMPPLYRLTQGKKSVYAQDDAEKDRFLADMNKGGKVEISRFKGLGEMNWKQLKETTMDCETRKLLQVKVPHADYTLHASFEDSDQLRIEEFVEQLMGRKAEKRFAFIQQNAQFVDNVDI